MGLVPYPYGGPPAITYSYVVLICLVVAVQCHLRTCTCKHVTSWLLFAFLTVTPILRWPVSCDFSIDRFVWPTVNHYSRSFEEYASLRNKSDENVRPAWRNNTASFHSKNGSSCQDLRILRFLPRVLMSKQEMEEKGWHEGWSEKGGGAREREAAQAHCIEHYGGFLMRECRKYFLVGMTTTTLQESVYLSEWLEYHLLLGFDKIIIMNKDDTGQVHAKLLPYVEQGVVEEMHSKSMLDQFENFEQIVKSLVGETFWISWFDLDEFWVPPYWAQDLRVTLEPFSHMRTAMFPKALTCHYEMFGESPWRHRPPDGVLVTEAFLMRAREDNPYGKSLTLLDAVDLENLHKVPHGMSMKGPYDASSYHVKLGAIILWWPRFQDTLLLTRVGFSAGLLCSGFHVCNASLMLALCVFSRRHLHRLRTPKKSWLLPMEQASAHSA